MNRPFRRFCFSLADKQGIDVDEVLQWDSIKITEWAGYYKTQNEEWLKEYEEEKQLEEQRNSNAEEKANRIRAFFTGKNNG